MPSDKTTNYEFDLINDSDSVKAGVKTKPNANWNALDDLLHDDFATKEDVDNLEDQVNLAWKDQEVINLSPFFSEPASSDYWKRFDSGYRITSDNWLCVTGINGDNSVGFTSSAMHHVEDGNYVLLIEARTISGECTLKVAKNADSVLGPTTDDTSTTIILANGEQYLNITASHNVFKSSLYSMLLFVPSGGRAEIRLSLYKAPYSGHFVPWDETLPTQIKPEIEFGHESQFSLETQVAQLISRVAELETTLAKYENIDKKHTQLQKEVLALQGIPTRTITYAHADENETGDSYQDTAALNGGNYIFIAQECKFTLTGKRFKRWVNTLEEPAEWVHYQNYWYKDDEINATSGDITLYPQWEDAILVHYMVPKLEYDEYGAPFLNDSELVWVGDALAPSADSGTYLRIGSYRPSMNSIPHAKYMNLSGGWKIYTNQGQYVEPSYDHTIGEYAEMYSDNPNELTVCETLFTWKQIAITAYAQPPIYNNELTSSKIPYNWVWASLVSYISSQVNTSYDKIGYSLELNGDVIFPLNSSLLISQVLGGVYTDHLYVYTKFVPKTAGISYNLKSGTGGPTAIAVGAETDVILEDGSVIRKELHVGDRIQITPSPTRTNYVFKGWTTSSFGAIVTVKPNGIYKLSKSGTTTLYALWAAERTLSFDANEGTGSMDSVIFGSGMKYDVPTCTFTPPTGMQFSHWNTAADGSGTSYELGTQMSITANTKIYAIWETPSE